MDLGKYQVELHFQYHTFFDQNLSAAMEFWLAWVDEATHGFPNFYPPFTKEMWPSCAQEIANQLAKGEPITNKLVAERFWPRPIDPSRIEKQSRQKWLIALSVIIGALLWVWLFLR